MTRGAGSKYVGRAVSESPRLLLCTFDVVPGPGGATRRLAESLDALGEHFTPEVLSVKGPEQAHIERFHGARLMRVPVGNGPLPARAEAFERAVRRQLESDDYAAVQFSDPFGGYALCEARGTRGYRLIYEALRFPSHELRDRWPELENDRKFLSRVRRRELYCLMNADRVITGSHVTRSFVQSLGVSADAIEVFPTPIDVGATLAPAIAEGGTLRCLYVGGNARWQGLETLLRGIALAQAEIELSLEIIGVDTPSALEPLGALLGDLGIADRVIFRGRLPNQNLAAAVGQADVVLLPLVDCERNRLQGGPLDRLAEVLATGRPIVAADLPLTRERLPGGCAVFHRPGDPAALSTALLQLARNPKKREEMGRRARAEAVRTLDVLRFRARLLRLYGELLGPAGPSGTGGSDDPTGSREPTSEALGGGTLESGEDTAEAAPAQPEVGLPALEADARIQALPRSRLREPGEHAHQETRVARLDALKPPGIPALGQPPGEAPQVLSGLPRVLQGIADVLAELPTAQTELPAELADPAPSPRAPLPGPSRAPVAGSSESRRPPQVDDRPRASPPGPPPLRVSTGQSQAVRPPLPQPRTTTGPVPRIGGGQPGSVPGRGAPPLIGGGSPPSGAAAAPADASVSAPRTQAAPPPLAAPSQNGSASTPPRKEPPPASPPPLPRTRTGEIPAVVRPQPSPPPLVRGASGPPPSGIEEGAREERLPPAPPELAAGAVVAGRTGYSLDDADISEVSAVMVAPGPGLEPPVESALDAFDDALLPGSDPWLLQILQGYCPPGNSKSFDRHAPPTTFPGRTASTDASSASQKVG